MKLRNHPGVEPMEQWRYRLLVFAERDGLYPLFWVLAKLRIL